MNSLLEMNKKLLEKIALQRQELENLRKASQVSIQSQIQPASDNSEETVTSDIKKESGFEEEIRKYLELLELIDKEDDIEKEVLGLLPQEDDYDKERLVKRLYIEYCKKIREATNFIQTEMENGADEEELVPFYEEIRKYEEIKSSLRKSTYLDQEIEEEDIAKNNLLFLTTDSGRIRTFEAIDDIDSRCYPALSELFASIIDGTFKSGKAFTDNDKVGGILEVRNLEYQLRVIYAPIAPKYYAVLGVMIKKTDANSRYKQLLISMVNNLNSQKKSLEKGLEDPEFCRQQEEYTKMLFEKLNFPKKQDAKKKVKTTLNS